MRPSSRDTTVSYVRHRGVLRVRHHADVLVQCPTHRTAGTWPTRRTPDYLTLKTPRLPSKISFHQHLICERVAKRMAGPIMEQPSISNSTSSRCIRSNIQQYVSAKSVWSMSKAGQPLTWPSLKLLSTACTPAQSNQALQAHCAPDLGISSRERSSASACCCVDRYQRWAL